MNAELIFEGLLLPPAKRNIPLITKCLDRFIFLTPYGRGIAVFFYFNQIKYLIRIKLSTNAVSSPSWCMQRRIRITNSSAQAKLRAYQSTNLPPVYSTQDERIPILDALVYTTCYCSITPSLTSQSQLFFYHLPSITVRFSVFWFAPAIVDYWLHATGVQLLGLCLACGGCND